MQYVLWNEPKLKQPRSQGSLLPAVSRSVGRVRENPGNEVEVEMVVSIGLVVYY